MQSISISSTKKNAIEKSSHDVKSLLASVKAYNELLKRHIQKSPTDSVAKTYTDKLDHQITAVITEIQQLVTLVRTLYE